MQVVFLVADYPMILEGLKKVMLEIDNNFNIFSFVCPKKCIEKSREFTPNLLITDLYPIGMDGAELVRKLKVKADTLKVIFATAYHKPWRVKSALKQKPNGLIFKNDPIEEISNAITAVVDGKTYYSDAVRDKVFEISFSLNDPCFTNREIEVINLIAEGKTSKEIALDMGVSVNTIETYRKTVFAKMEVNNSVRLIIKAIKLGIIKDQNT